MSAGDIYLIAVEGNGLHGEEEDKGRWEHSITFWRSNFELFTTRSGESFRGIFVFSWL